MFSPGDLFKGFHPNQISSLVLWLDAADPAGNGVWPADSSSLTTWVDKSIQGNNFTQSTSASKPTFQKNILGNLPAILGNGTSHNMSCATSNGFPTGSGGELYLL